MFRVLCLGLLAVTVLPAQVMTEMGAAATGGLVGAAAGKPVSDGVASVLGKVDQLTKEAAGDKDKGKSGKEKAKPVAPLQMGPSQEAGQIPRAYSVPDPPPLPNRNRRVAPVQTAAAGPAPDVESTPLPSGPIVPQVTLSQLQPGMDRDSVTQVRSPAIRITSFDDGHLVEVYKYLEGVVKVTDGTVESVVLR